MDHKSTHHGDGVEAQLLSNCLGVVHLQDLAGDEEHDAEGKVPGVTGQPRLGARQSQVCSLGATIWASGLMRGWDKAV